MPFVYKTCLQTGAALQSIK